MQAGPSIPFVRRVKFGEVDSICTKCFRTIATAPTQDELVEAENAHQCDGIDLISLIHPSEPTHKG